MISEPRGPTSSRIKNFHRVESWLYRGGQPDLSGWEEIKKLGIRTVISLRWNFRVIERERKLVSEAGIHYESIPLTYWDWPNQATIERYLSILDDPERHPVFLHCLHGSDRTGLLIAIFRLARQNWSADDAYKEMRQHGFHRIWLYHFKWALYDFERRQRK